MRGPVAECWVDGAPFTLPESRKLLFPGSVLVRADSEPPSTAASCVVTGAELVKDAHYLLVTPSASRAMVDSPLAWAPLQPLDPEPVASRAGSKSLNVALQGSQAAPAEPPAKRARKEAGEGKAKAKPPSPVKAKP
eukprot:Hpha_TRINITY_DN34491_c0_g1::TRINITY_DN34491_c0_g1_i1::g.96125::m.96125